MRSAYDLNGLKLESDFDLPGLPCWDGQGAADLVFRRGDVPLRLDRPNHVAPVFQTDADGEYLLTLPGTGRMLVRNGNEVTIALDVGATADGASAVLTGAIASVLWHQRGLLPLHASAVEFDGGAVALCGFSAMGKSTLAAALAAQGHAVIADDVCVVDAHSDADISVLPGGPPLRLWRDAIDLLDITPTRLRRVRPDKEQFFLDEGDYIQCESRKLAAVVLLSRQESGAVAMERIRGAHTTGELCTVVHMRRLAHALGRGPYIFSDLTRLVSTGVAIWRLQVPEGRVGLRLAAAQVLNTLEG